MDRPDFIEDDHLIFLDELRESGQVNMFGAASYIVDEFDVTTPQSRETLSYWMQTFNDRHPNGR